MLQPSEFGFFQGFQSWTQRHLISTSCVFLLAKDYILLLYFFMYGGQGNCSNKRAVNCGHVINALTANLVMTSPQTLAENST